MVDYLAELNTHERDIRIVFDEGPHIYTVKGDSNYTSVTTLVHKHFAEFDADKIIRKMMAGRNWMFSKYFGMTADEIKESWDKIFLAITIHSLVCFKSSSFSK